MSDKRTPFYDMHQKLGAKIIPFAGYLMPVMYDSITAEHLRVRSTVGMFDISHMGEFTVSGPGAEAFVQRLVTNDVTKLVENQVMYSCMCYEHGGIVDDLLVYKLKDHYLLVVNASNIDKDFAHIQSHAPDDVKLTDISDSIALIAIQGPLAAEVTGKICDYPLDSLKYYNAAPITINGTEVLLSRTGYTGEDGFELYIPAQSAGKIWADVYSLVKERDGGPIGLGARDSLRLEMKFALYGNDISEKTNPIEAGLGWVVKLDKGDFVGRGPIAKMKEDGPTRKLVGFELEGKVFPRQHYPIVKDDKSVGEVTSGLFSPSLKKAIGMGYVPSKLAKPGSQFEVDNRGKKIPAVVVKTPFYKRNG
jgi:aminomethyltransferase